MGAQTYWCMVKGVSGHASTPPVGQAWIGSRRGLLRIFNDRLELGDWVIPFDQIEDAVMLTYKYLFVVPAGVLNIKTTDGASYHFGYNPWAAPAKHLPRPPRTEALQVRYSPLSIGIRVAALSYIGFRVWRDLLS